MPDDRPLPRPRPTLQTVGQVAARYGVSARKVRSWIDQGAFRVVRTPGGQIRIPDDDPDGGT